MKILVTGANGMLGQDLVPILSDNGFDVVPTDVDTLDITNEDEVLAKIKEIMPDFVVHCAAYTNVDAAESNVELAQKINYIGSKNIARAVSEINSGMVYISTDYVFDGENNKPYQPNDKTNPINVYGKTKLQGEQAVIENCEKYYIARTSWLYGHKGKNFVETMISLAQKPELKVVDDQIGCPTWTQELCFVIVKLIKEKMPYGIYHTCGGGFTTWHGFAKEIFKQMNLEVNLKPCTTDEFPRDAKRPKYSIMDNGGLCPDWKLSLKKYIELRK